MEEEKDIPASGAVFTFGRSRFADNIPSHFFIRNDPVVDIDCGDEHTTVVCQNGRVFAFGSNEWGQLGLGHRSVVTKPSCIKSLKPEQATHVACGRAHTIISSASGKVFACGNNSDGQLGVGDTTDKDSPVSVEGVTGTVVQLSAGCNHSAALNSNGEVFVWGSNADGQLGLGEEIKSVTTPAKLQLNESIAKIACGYYHTVLLTEEGRVLVCGEGEAGKLGLGSTETVFTPTPVTLSAWPIQVAAGGSHTLVVAVDGKVFGWGSNLTGQLGLSDNKLSEVLVPTLIHTLDSRVIKDVACGESHSAFISELGELLTCGETRHGKLGCEASGPDPNCNTEPVRVPRFKPFTVTKVRCGGCHTMILASLRSEGAEDHLSNGHVPNNSLQPPEVDVVSPPIHRGALPPLQRVPHISSTSMEDKLSQEDSKSSITVTNAEDNEPHIVPELSLELVPDSNEKVDLEKDEDTNNSDPVTCHDAASKNENIKSQEEEKNSSVSLKRQQAFDTMKSQSQSTLETCEETISNSKPLVENKINGENLINGKINSIKKSKMCILI